MSASRLRWSMAAWSSWGLNESPPPVVLSLSAAAMVCCRGQSGARIPTRFLCAAKLLQECRVVGLARVVVLQVHVKMGGGRGEGQWVALNELDSHQGFVTGSWVCMYHVTLGRTITP